MKYLLMMFGDQAGMMERPATTPEWIGQMIAFMTDIDRELTESGELVLATGLADAPTAKLLTMREGQPVMTDGPFAESKESLAGFWLVDVESEERALELASRIVVWSDRLEVRRVDDVPPEV